MNMARQEKVHKDFAQETVPPWPNELMILRRVYLLGQDTG
jgi:hypothetical protein